MSKNHHILINRCKKGDDIAMMQIYDLYCDAMFQISCRYLNEEDAKDIMQESFIKAFTKLESFNPEYTFGSWLKRIVINSCIDELKKRRLKFVEKDILEIQIEDDNDWHVESEITKEQVCAAIAKLPHKYQVVVQLYLIEGYDHEEISEIIGIPVKTSRTHLRRGRLKLQELLKTY